MKPEYTFVTVYVLKPGNLSEPSRVKRIKKMVSQFESIEGCNGPRFTKIWIRDYETFLNATAEEMEETSLAPYSEESIRQFMSWPEYSHWGGFIRYANSSDTWVISILLLKTVFRKFREYFFHDFGTFVQYTDTERH